MPAAAGAGSVSINGTIPAPTWTPTTITAATMGTITDPVATPPVPQRAPAIAPARSMTTDRAALAPPLMSPAEMHSKFRDAVASAMQAAWHRTVPPYALYFAPPSTYPASLPRPPASAMPLPIPAVTAANVPLPP
ncbi:hypothetical protein AMAG_18372 [Allomyces macrogynus ATCC 38327]|uniref:Uncharacterized protein n=1 Tax=Allomyces macrogynus (strain ATCC 38327) TaxID=578462 RepID=A0A0L0S6Q2_ALLM3|nr:hypothetical protein AMAG_18372 [Allomyces macrogynus ATCC 38327]|eukprot:KNE58110.1 hypothetical protein AMAG_18372 [Allomyces macrogynus ATCC 38327]